jgi:cytochrome c biogenesis protein CcdA
MVATVNPCGFAMLPAYLSFFIGLEGRDEDVPGSGHGRCWSARRDGFAATFAVFGLVVSRVTQCLTWPRGSRW